MNPVVAVIAAGGMGAAVGARLVENGVRVLTSLEGRSAESAARAKAAGMIAASDPEIASADIVLSIVPPGEALPLAQKLAPALNAANKKPVYADCNAVNPDTVKRIAAVIAQAGCPFVDAGIIGGPPRAGYNGPSFYVSGEDAGKIEPLNELGLVIRRMDGPIGAASAI
jgi:L-threonate 2-dehydrogenase